VDECKPLDDDDDGIVLTALPNTVANKKEPTGTPLEGAPATSM
jgi:hypothetical protein